MRRLKEWCLGGLAVCITGATVASLVYVPWPVAVVLVLSSWLSCDWCMWRVADSQVKRWAAEVKQGE